LYAKKGVTVINYFHNNNIYIFECFPKVLFESFLIFRNNFLGSEAFEKKNHFFYITLKKVHKRKYGCGGSNYHPVISRDSCLYFRCLGQSMNYNKKQLLSAPDQIIKRHPNLGFHNIFLNSENL